MFNNFGFQVLKLAFCAPAPVFSATIEICAVDAIEILGEILELVVDMGKLRPVDVLSHKSNLHF